VSVSFCFSIIMILCFTFAIYVCVSSFLLFDVCGFGTRVQEKVHDLKRNWQGKH